MRWDSSFDKRERVMFSAFSAVVASEGDLGFEWRVTQADGLWSVKDSAAELLPETAGNRRFDSSSEAIRWCEAEEARTIAECRERSAA